MSKEIKAHNGTKFEAGQVWSDEDHTDEFLFIGIASEGFPVFERLYDHNFMVIEKYWKSGLLRRFIGIMEDGQVI